MRGTNCACLYSLRLSVAIEKISLKDNRACERLVTVRELPVEYTTRIR